MMLGHGFADGHLLETFRRIALFGSEIDAINQALNAGSNPQDLVMSPSLIPIRTVAMLRSNLQ
jgi:hypothetical protein